MILDQRHLSGDTWLGSPEAIEYFWQRFAAKQRDRLGFAFSQRKDAAEFRVSAKKLVAYLNHSRWCADCPQKDCNGGIALWRDHDKAACLDCGTIYKNIAWPKEEDVRLVEAMALLIPNDHMRNWRPDEEGAKEAVKRLREVTIL